MKLLAILFRKRPKVCLKCGSTVHAIRNQVLVWKLDAARRVVSKTVEVEFSCVACGETWWEVLK